MAVSKTLRFEVFKRDLFTCQYCGKTPPAVVLELDHIHPRSKGGKDTEENLNTACFDCNRGKAAGLITTVIPSTSDKAVRIAEAEEQLKQFQKVLRAKRKRENKDIDAIQFAFQHAFGGYVFSDRFRENIRNQFLPKLACADLISFMDIACDRMPDRDRAIKYFCGICWRTIKESHGA